MIKFCVSASIHMYEYSPYLAACLISEQDLLCTQLLELTLMYYTAYIWGFKPSAKGRR